MSTSTATTAQDEDDGEDKDDDVVKSNTTSNNNSNNDINDNNNHKNNVVPFLLADIGEGIREVEILQWHVKVGDKVQEFDIICQVQSDKATVDITSRFAGTVVQVSSDTTILVGQPLVHIATSSPTNTTTTTKATSTSSSSSTVTNTRPITMSTMRSDEACDGQATGSSSLPVADTTLSSSNQEVNRHQDTTAGATTTKYLTSPAVRKLAADYRIDLSTLRGTGPQGRILKGDLLPYIADAGTTVATTTTNDPHTPLPHKSVSPTVTMDQSSNRGDVYGTGTRIVTLTGYQRAMFQSMTESLRIPHMTLGDEIVVDKLIQFRNEWNNWIPSAPKRGSRTGEGEETEGNNATVLKLGLQTLLIKACSMALKEFPSINAKVHDADHYQVCYHDNHDIGVAMDTPRVDRKSVV